MLFSTSHARPLDTLSQSKLLVAALESTIYLCLSVIEQRKTSISNKMSLPRVRVYGSDIEQEQLLESKATLDILMKITWAAGSALKILMKLKSTYNFVRGPSLKGGGWIYLTGEGCWTSGGG